MMREPTPNDRCRLASQRPPSRSGPKAAPTRRATTGFATAALTAVVLAVTACRGRGSEVIVFHATSLTQALGEAAELFQRDNPSVRVRLEPSGSQVAARKLTELGMSADVVIVADTAIVDRMLVPEHASFDLTIATNEMVIAHKDHSRFTDEITTENWTAILVRPGVRLGRANPDTSSIGYHTLLTWELAQRWLNTPRRSVPKADPNPPVPVPPDLVAQLRAHCDDAHVVHDETELRALLESGAIDYAFLYRSTAEDHHLKITALPSKANLSTSELRSFYADAEVEVRMERGAAKQRVRGAPITYGLTIPLLAPNAKGAAQFASLLISDQGRRIFERRGFRPVKPAHCEPCIGVPKELGPWISSER
jgi:molybdate/tungstate transport system substrate-binding protein